MDTRLFALLSLLLIACGTSGADSSSADDDTSGFEEPDSPLPIVQRDLGRLVSGRYLFPGSAIGSDAELAPAHLVRVDPDAFVVSVDGGPHRSVSRREVWPMACLRREIQIEEGALSVRLGVGAPVLVLASSTDGARVSVALDTEHSQVMRASELNTDACPIPAVDPADRNVSRVDAEDAVCVFPDQETLDESAGIVVPAGAPLRELERDGDWSQVRVSLAGGSVTGWVSAASTSASPAERDANPWSAALRNGDCLYPGRPERSTAGILESDPDTREAPTIAPAALEQVVRTNEPQVRACYEARLEEVPNLSVDLELFLLIDADGRVFQSQVTRGGSADVVLTRCVIDRSRRWRFPAPRTGTVQARRTFQLRP